VTPDRHPSEELLLDHASGALPEAAALLVATHLALCPKCRAGLAALEHAGAELFELAEAPPLDPGLLERTLARLAEAAPEPQPAPRASGWPPRPLRDYLSGGFDELPWRRRLSGVYSCPVPGVGRGKAEMLRIEPGRSVPHHTHRGVEMTLVLDGSYRDSLGRFARGDVCVADETIEHRPVADRDADCICLTVTEAPLRFSGPFGWIANPLQRF
jgi:putative transcriptional regulator